MYSFLNTKYKINDFRRIRFNGNNDENEEKKDDEKKIPLLTSVNVNKFHDESIDFLSKELQRAKEDNKDVIILTHHAPTDYKTIYPEADPKTNPIGYGMNYASMEQYFKKPLVAWFSGHTHSNCDYFVKSNDKKEKDHLIRIASNQQGYIVGYNKNNAPKDYSNNKIFVFPSNHKLNENVPQIEFNEFKKYLIDKSTLIPNGSFFTKSPLLDNDDNSKETTQHVTGGKCDNCKIL